MLSPNHIQVTSLSLTQLLKLVANDPYEYFVRRWNWKSAATSALIRGAIFFFANLSSGWSSATGAMLTEFCYRSAISGFYGSLIQVLRRADPPWTGLVAAGVGLPVISHTIEFAVHWARGTPRLGRSIGISIAFTCLSTLFNFYAMRRGVLLVGEERRSLISDLAAMPGLIAGFVLTGVRLLFQSVSRVSATRRT